MILARSMGGPCPVSCGRRVYITDYMSSWGVAPGCTLIVGSSQADLLTVNPATSH